MDFDRQIIDLGAKLTEIIGRNTASTIMDKINASKAKKDNQKTINELEEIINGLISDKNELVQISQAYKQEFVAQQISKSDIQYITNNFVPVIRDLLLKSAEGNNAKIAEIQGTFDSFTPLLSVETLTVLQLIGFNFKKAIGEPLTVLLQKNITAKIPVDTVSNLEYAQLNIKYQTELSKVAQDKEASERFERLQKIS